MATPAEPLLPAFPPSLKERYRPKGSLGRGGMGEVFEAVDTRLDRAVAVKVLHAGIAEDSTLERFRREASALARIRHPQVVEVYDHGTVEGAAYLVMELVQGTRIDRVGKAGDALPAMLRVADGLEAVHAAGLIHRDVKPANIMVTRDGRPVLLDFGLVFDPDRTRLTAEVGIVGTLAFLAPEALAHGHPLAASDWYAWGTSLYLLREGVLPFTLPELLEGVKTGRLPEPKFTVIEAGSGEARMLEACLRARPEERPGSLGELRLLLEAGAGSGASLGLPFGFSSIGTGDLSQAHAKASSTRVAIVPPARPLAAGLGLAGLVLLLGMRQTRGPGARSTSPAPPGVEAGDPGVRIRDDLEWAGARAMDRRGTVIRDGSLAADEDRVRPLLEPDPERWGKVVTALPSVRDFLSWVAEGGRPEAIDPGMRRALREADGEFARRGLPEPFWPYAYLEPEGEDLPVPGLLGHPAYRHLPVPATSRGWLATGLGFLDRAARRQRELDSSLEEHRGRPIPPPGFPPGVWERLVPVPGPGIWELARSLSGSPDLRVALQPYLAEGGRLLHAGLYALGRSLRDQPEHAELAACLLAAPVDAYAAWYYEARMSLAPGQLLAGPASSGAAALAHASLLRIQILRSRRMGNEDSPEARTSVLALLEAAAAPAPPGSDPGAGVRAEQGFRHWLSARSERAIEDPLAFLALHGERIGRLPERMHPHLWLELARAMARRGPGAQPDLPEVVRCRLASLAGRLSAAEADEAKRLAGDCRPGTGDQGSP